MIISFTLAICFSLQIGRSDCPLSVPYQYQRRHHSALTTSVYLIWGSADQSKSSFCRRGLCCCWSRVALPASYPLTSSWEYSVNTGSVRAASTESRRAHQLASGWAAAIWVLVLGLFAFVWSRRAPWSSAEVIGKYSPDWGSSWTAWSWTQCKGLRGFGWTLASSVCLLVHYMAVAIIAILSIYWSSTR